MKKTFVSVVVVVVVALLLTVFVSAQGPANATNGAPPAAPRAGSDSQPVGEPEVAIPEQYRPGSPAAPEAAASLVYFTPQDENTSTTVIFLYNTGTAAATVNIRTYSVTGAATINTNVSVPAKRLVRIAADTVSTISASWSDAVLINFTTSSAYGTLSLPSGVKAEAYVAWNNADTYDPLAVVPTLPIRFSTDPTAVFMPALSK